jgi:hypothetical protein
MERKKNYRAAHIRLSCAALIALCSVSAAPAPVSQPWPLVLRLQMKRMADVGFRIGVTAGPLCPSRAAGTGIAVDYIESYELRDRPTIAALLGMTEAPQVAAVAAGSPAEAAGVMPGDELIEIGGIAVARLRTASSDKPLFADELEQFLAGMPVEQRVKLSLRRHERVFQVEVMPRPICSARFVIKTGSEMAAFSDGINVAISSKMIQFASNDDELALIAAHETGHIINRDREAKSLSERRQMEDRADVMSVRLSKCAGYRPDEGFQFWLRRDAQDWLGFLRSPTHRSRKARVELMRRETGVVVCPPLPAYVLGEMREETELREAP